MKLDKIATPIETFRLLVFCHQDANGNTYHVVRVTDEDNNEYCTPITYGYGDQYKQTALKLINDSLNKNYQYSNPYDSTNYIKLDVIFGPWYVRKMESLRRVIDTFNDITRNVRGIA